MKIQVPRNEEQIIKECAEKHIPVSAIEKYTCAMTCHECKSKVYFIGRWGDLDIPDTWYCPSCISDTAYPPHIRIKRKKQIDDLKEAIAESLK